MSWLGFNQARQTARCMSHWNATEGVILLPDASGSWSPGDAGRMLSRPRLCTSAASYSAAAVGFSNACSERKLSPHISSISEKACTAPRRKRAICIPQDGHHARQCLPIQQEQNCTLFKAMEMGRMASASSATQSLPKPFAAAHFAWLASMIIRNFRAGNKLKQVGGPANHRAGCSSGRVCQVPRSGNISRIYALQRLSCHFLKLSNFVKARQLLDSFTRDRPGFVVFFNTVTLYILWARSAS